jgi:hypothetical protein
MPSGSFIVGATPGAGANLPKTLSFPDIQSCINYAVAAGLATLEINLAPGNYSTAPIAIPQNIGLTIEGGVSGAALLGDITWTCSGGLSPLVPQSYLVLRNTAPNSITIVDGTSPATKALLILENSAVFANIAQTGTSVLECLVSGISTASSAIAGENVSSLIIGNISLPSAEVGLTNTQIIGTIQCQQLWTNGCQIDGAVVTTASCQFAETLCSGNVTGTTIYLDNVSFTHALSVPLTLSGAIAFIEGPLPLAVTPIASTGSHPISLGQTLSVITPPVSGVGNIILSLPAVPTALQPLVIGMSYRIANNGWSGTMTIVSSDGSLINGAHLLNLTFTYGCATFYYIAGGTWIASSTGG